MYCRLLFPLRRHDDLSCNFTAEVIFLSDGTCCVIIIKYSLCSKTIIQCSDVIVVVVTVFCVEKWVGYGVRIVLSIGVEVRSKTSQAPLTIYRTSYNNFVIEWVNNRIKMLLEIILTCFMKIRKGEDRKCFKNPH